MAKNEQALLKETEKKAGDIEKNPGNVEVFIGELAFGSGHPDFDNNMPASMVDDVLIFHLVIMNG